MRLCISLSKLLSAVYNDLLCLDTFYNTFRINVQMYNSGIFRCKTVQVQPVRKVVHAAMFPGIALSKSAWSPAPVRIQRATDQDVRVRRMRTHDKRTRSSLLAPEGQAPVQPGSVKVLRQAALQVHQFQLCQHVAASPHVELKHTCACVGSVYV